MSRPTSAPEMAFIQRQIEIILLIAALATIGCLLLLLVDQVKRRFGISSSSSFFTSPSKSRTNDSWRAEDDVDHQKVYLLAPTPGQKWTSHFSHVSPSGMARAVDEKRLTELLTPSKDWWSGHKTGTPADLNEKDLAAMPKLDFGDAAVVKSSSKKTSSSSSRRSRKQTAVVEEQEEEVKQQAVEQQDSDDVDFAPGGGDDDHSEDAREEVFSPDGSEGSRSSRKSGTPSRHRRQWTHTIVPGIEEARIHRKGRQLF